MIDFADLEAVDICPRRDNLSRLRLLPATHSVKSPYSIHNFSCFFVYLFTISADCLYLQLFTFFVRLLNYLGFWD